MANWGGKRAGAGRKPTGRTRTVFYLSETEKDKVKILIKSLRA
jgi:hypothetical protein